MNWFLISEIAYFIILVPVSLRIIYDTRSTTKTLAYLLVVILIPFFGLAFYFTFGVNYRKRKIYSKKLIENNEIAKRIQKELYGRSVENMKNLEETEKGLAQFLLQDSASTLTKNNMVKVLVNGEEKFEEVKTALKEAKDHIHLEYYIFEDDTIGKEIENILIEKAREGVTVRFIYDAFGSRSISKKMVPRLKKYNIQVFPFMKIIFVPFANRLNHRNHRKIIVIDGVTAFIGGINVKDEYINNGNSHNRCYWRDTHLRIDGPGVRYLQYLFLCDWNFCAGHQLKPNRFFFPNSNTTFLKNGKMVQIAASGPDSETPTIFFSLLKSINSAQNEILITTPYFIPGENLLDAIIIAASSGVSVKLLVPGKSDSWFVNKAAISYYGELLEAGVEIYIYKKGFMHAKTMVVDNNISIVGSSNMDQRSFDLNFEANAIVYDAEIAGELRKIFLEDLENSEKLNGNTWLTRSGHKVLLEKTVKLLSPLL